MQNEPSAQVHGELRPVQLLLSTRAAAHALSLSPRKLWSLTAGGKIPCVRIGRAVRYDLNDLREWIESHKHQGRA
ncbi:MAG: helix-turn-helix domain-containing protein [Planctomycetes bacterium]|nr:helix-turn-helix domain-containing protein [Planctomycetota bacterium]